MDTFMDKLAEKLNAGEIIRANRAADARELERLQEKAKEYAECLQQLERINQEMKKTTANLGKELAEKAELAALSAQTSADMQQRTIEESGTAVMEHVHKESVKVYRNVQAVVLEESARQTEKLAEMTAILEEMKAAQAVKKTPGILKAILGISLTTMILTIALVAYQVLVYLQII